MNLQVIFRPCHLDHQPPRSLPVSRLPVSLHLRLNRLGSRSVRIKAKASLELALLLIQLVNLLQPLSLLTAPRIFSSRGLMQLIINFPSIQAARLLLSRLPALAFLSEDLGATSPPNQPKHSLPFLSALSKLQLRLPRMVVYLASLSRTTRLPTRCKCHRRASPIQHSPTRRPHFKIATYSETLTLTRQTYFLPTPLRRQVIRLVD